MLSEVRKLLGHTQKDLAERVGVTQNYYAVIESNPTKSAPLMKKLSIALKIREQFLAFGDRSSYPFMGDFYIFYLEHFKPFAGYDFLKNNVCMESKFIDLIIFLKKSDGFSRHYSTICLAMRDDKDIIYLVTCEYGFRHVKKNVDIEKSNTVDKATIFARPAHGLPQLDLFRKDLYKDDRLMVYEKTVMAPETLYPRLVNGKIGRKDVEGFFPNRNHFKLLYEAHSEID